MKTHALLIDLTPQQEEKVTGGLILTSAVALALYWKSAAALGVIGGAWWATRRK
ncbi:MAG: hypothetical protein GW795_15525 [Cyanobacteria bacterium]|nr:hypothetical protein [Cyanobacteria bacterium CG_2015-22_32_23]NCQ05820.1 hypothetical protein [Cyanobacteria bacterium CG_2015-09_32_10]NCQ43234.1 hypothetical protein [Cyanobacteria bacterium CG_2015-04_32_10]